ncbi:MAG: tRNA (adenosine(37)-N6)-threonylcarbamoyltransferase complex dimerization subunit type 1 TsaB [Christensenellaceae bacterium]|nr:tRNA (adenosine(37)-N6)-threonylcarbamoyltransferase complex dimerization subunit type 1 TsaB [Christensenellaceae bacterium]
MKLLAIDTSGPVCGVAIQTEQGTRCECAVLNKLTHSVNLLPMIDEAFRATGLTIADMDRLAVTVGPGSFTGVRIGVSTVKGLAHGADKPCVAVDALEAMAAGITAFDGVVCPMQDARAGQVYGAAFRVGSARPQRLMDDIPLRLEDFLEAIAAHGDRFLFLGDGMPVHREKIAAMLGDRAVFAPPHQAYLRPGSVAYLASLTEETVDYRELMPLYLRAPSAERNRKLVEAAHAE